MNEQQIDRERLAEWRDQTARIVEKYGNEAWAEIHANEVVAIIDALTQAEAERDEARATKDMHKERAQQALADVDQAEARIKAAQDVLDRAHDEFEQPDESAIRRALEG